MAEPNPPGGRPLAESLANNVNESMQWMARLWSGSLASPPGVPQAGMPAMMMPTLDPQELERRIADLRAVEHWLDMNRALLHSTIQALEMQRDAILALRSMAQPMAAPAAGADPSRAASWPPQPGAGAPAAPGASGAATPPFDAGAWWNALHEQFTRVASAAAQGQTQAPTPEPEKPAKDAAPPRKDPPGKRGPS